MSTLVFSGAFRAISARNGPSVSDELNPMSAFSISRPYVEFWVMLASTRRSTFVGSPVR